MVRTRRLTNSDQEIITRMARAFVGSHKKEIDNYKKELVDFLKPQSQIPFEILASRLVDFRRSRSGDRFLDWNQFNKIREAMSHTSTDKL